MAVLFIVLAAILLSCAESRTGSQCKIESKEFEVLVLVVLRSKGSFFFFFSTGRHSTFHSVKTCKEHPVKLL